MTPIAEFGGGPISDLTLEQQKDFASKVLDATLDVLKVPDKEDREMRMPQITEDHEGGDSVLRISYTVGPNEYPDFEESNFNPTTGQRELLAKAIAQLRVDSKLPPMNLEIIEWKDTAFKLFGDEIDENAVLDKDALDDVLNEVGSYKMRLFVNSQKFEDAFKDAIPNTEVILVEGSDAPVALEFDSDMAIDNKVKERLADIFEQGLISRMGKSDLSGENFQNSTVWIRSGAPKVHSYSSHELTQ